MNDYKYLDKCGATPRKRAQSTNREMKRMMAMRAAVLESTISFESIQDIIGKTDDQS